MSFAPQNAVVWTEIPVSDLDASVRFYNTVFGFDLKIDDSGPNPMAMISTADSSGVAGHLYPGKPSENGGGPTIHFGVPDTLEMTAKRFGDAGGKILTDPFTIPQGRFVYGLDPDGNSIGMFEYSG